MLQYMIHNTNGSKCKIGAKFYGISFDVICLINLWTTAYTKIHDLLLWFVWIAGVSDSAEQAI